MLFERLLHVLRISRFFRVCCVLSDAAAIETWGLLTYGTGPKNGSKFFIICVAVILFTEFKFSSIQAYFST